MAAERYRKLVVTSGLGVPVLRLSLNTEAGRF